MNFKRIVMAGLSLAAVMSLAACGQSKKASAQDEPKQLNVQFVPSQQANTLEAKAKPLAKLLQKELGIPVKVSVSTDYNSIVEAMASNQVQVGFLPPDGYVQAHRQKAADVLLQAQRFAVVQPDGKTSDKLTDSYRSEILVKTNGPIKSIQDLKGKKIAVQEATSSSGYIWPAAELKAKGIDVATQAKLVTVKGHDQGVMAVLNGDADAAFVWEDARTVVQKDVPDVMQKLTPIYFTQPIPNDTISVAKSLKPAFRAKLAKAFMKIAKSKADHAIISEVYGHEGYVKSKDSNFDIVRTYEKRVEAAK
ncbi:phosphate/phosphite/phosphonate ABC transporter substrate-binding protein [Lacticaseibacillus parakribbianus]|uniref:phosphate/phosphite/phosphonate ABC transporter substrate-binding protein n=1 Tax=Lacticaseibacillus parakribbianus TaxID=2970927 RepID=UPI0021CB7160|nr:phosphate/phosphite/phosphonate ABC transporter substrate-binding protein [Lacticaseibacillus parakribbianus]